MTHQLLQKLQEYYNDPNNVCYYMDSVDTNYFTFNIVNIKTKEIIQFRAASGQNVAALKSKICAFTGIPDTEQQLFFDGQLMMDQEPLNHYPIKEECVIHLQTLPKAPEKRLTCSRKGLTVIVTVTCISLCTILAYLYLK